ncbi:hypothetical protein PG999_014439 [Apiospora kogelbergensis]|uniref:Uncharacterized protein n=1 Tax=Apiospora kogelbergensis TaxID=1337665 RepID=A0AAW0QIN8_9PEZI
MGDPGPVADLGVEGRLWTAVEEQRESTTNAEVVIGSEKGLLQARQSAVGGDNSMASKALVRTAPPFAFTLPTSTEAQHMLTDIANATAHVRNHLARALSFGDGPQHARNRPTTPTLSRDASRRHDLFLFSCSRPPKPHVVPAIVQPPPPHHPDRRRILLHRDGDDDDASQRHGRGRRRGQRPQHGRRRGHRRRLHGRRRAAARAGRLVRAPAQAAGAHGEPRVRPAAQGPGGGGGGRGRDRDGAERRPPPTPALCASRLGRGGCGAGGSGLRQGVEGEGGRADWKELS